MMPTFFEPTGNERELSLIAAGRSRPCGEAGKPKAIIWRPPITNRFKKKASHGTRGGFFR